MVVEICIIYYIKNNYMFWPFSLAIFRLINEKLSKQLHLTCEVWNKLQQCNLCTNHLLKIHSIIQGEKDGVMY